MRDKYYDDVYKLPAIAESLFPASPGTLARAHKIYALARKLVSSCTMPQLSFIILTVILANLSLYPGTAVEIQP
jgi:hypothetical protein